MPPITLAILASVLHMQGADATITSDNKGVDDLLATIRGQLEEQVDPNSPRIHEAAYNKNFTKTTYDKTRYGKGLYIKDYSKYGAARGGGGAATPSTGIIAKPPEGGTRR